MSLTRLHGLENEVWLIRNRGFSIFESSTMKGPEGRFFLKGKHVTPQEVRAFARTLEQRAKAGFNTPLPAAAKAFQAVPVIIIPKRKEPPMTDRYRGLNEADILADMRRMEEAVGRKRALELTGAAKSSWVNALAGHQGPSASLIAGLYGPEGINLRPQLAKVLRLATSAIDTPAGDAAEAAGHGAPLDEKGLVCTEAPQVQPHEDNHCEDCDLPIEICACEDAAAHDAAEEPPAGEAGEDAGSDLVDNAPVHQEPVASPADTGHAELLVDEAPRPDRLRTALDAAKAEIRRQQQLVDQELEALEDEKRQLEADADKLRKAEAALDALVS